MGSYLFGLFDLLFFVTRKKKKLKQRQKMENENVLEMDLKVDVNENLLREIKESHEPGGVKYKACSVYTKGTFAFSMK